LPDNSLIEMMGAAMFAPVALIAISTSERVRHRAGSASARAGGSA
jgi:hypothetical protein